MLSRFPAETHGELFGSGDGVPLAAAPFAPMGRLVPIDGDDGYRVSGRWEWATGIWHSGWCLVHGFDEGVELGTRFAVVPVGDLLVEDTWHTSGMRATGSAAVVLDDVIVPAHRTVAGDDLRGAVGAVAGDGLAGLPLLSVLALVSSASAVGAAQAAVDRYAERLGSRVLAYSLGDRAEDQPLAQARLASVTSDLETTLAGWRATLAEVAACVGADGGGGAGRGASPGLDDRQRVRVRLAAAAAAVRASRRTIGDVGEGAGASVYATSHPLQRLQRDVETLKGHVSFDWDRTTELAGRVMLGGRLGPTDMA